MLKRAEALLALLLTLAVITLHVVRALSAGALWRDEAGAVQLATLPTLGEVFEHFPHEAFPMLFPLTVRGTTAVFGDSDTVLRLFGLAVGLGIVAALWLNARAAGTVPIASLALLGFHPHFLVYGDSLRGYGLGTLLILLTFWAFSRLVVRPDRATVAVAAVLSILSVHCLFHNAALLLGLGLAPAVVGLLRRRWRVAVAALGAGLLGALTLLPYLGPLAKAREWDVVITEKLAPGKILAACLATVGFPSYAVAWVWGGLLVAGAVVTFRPKPIDDARLFRLLTIPAICLAQFALFVELSYLPRIWYMLPLMAVVASCLDGLLGGGDGLRVPGEATGRSQSPRERAGHPQTVRAGRLAVPFLIAALALPATLEQARLRMTNVDKVAAKVAAEAKPKDLVLVNYWFFGVSFQRYYRGQARWMTMPALADHRFHRYDLLKARMTADDPNRDVRRAIRRALRTGRRVWVVGTLDAPPPGQPPLNLPPAPGAFSGWQDAPYCISWSQQLNLYLETHARHHDQFFVRARGPVSGFEHLRLHVFRGWQDEPPAS